MFSTFDLCLLLYVIRLAGWLKHCNLSLSLSLSQQTLDPRTAVQLLDNHWPKTRFGMAFVQWHTVHHATTECQHEQSLQLYMSMAGLVSLQYWSEVLYDSCLRCRLYRESRTDVPIRQVPTSRQAH